MIEKNKIVFLIFAIITAAMFFTGLGLGLNYSLTKRNLKTYNQNCLEQFNYTCGFCPESNGNYYTCENDLMVPTKGHDKTIKYVSICLMTINPASVFLFYLICEQIKTRRWPKKKTPETSLASVESKELFYFRLQGNHISGSESKISEDTDVQ